MIAPGGGLLFMRPHACPILKIHIETSRPSFVISRNSLFALVTEEFVALVVSQTVEKFQNEGK
jgi:hypothetical protein